MFSAVVLTPAPMARNRSAVFVPSCLYFRDCTLRLCGSASRSHQSDGCAGSRFTHLYAAIEFFQKYFSATARGFVAK